MPDPCDFCPTDDCDQGQHTADCPNSDQNVDLYYGFIQALCWASGAMPTRFNEPDELWLPCINDNIKFSRHAFLTHFAIWDDGPVMMLRLNDDTTWDIFCTEHPESMGYAEAEQQGFAFAAEWADRG
jgi:hypothetical protein